MPGQGPTTRAIADKLSARGWKVVYTCIPNTAHVKVVPIPTTKGSAKQHYHDIVAYKDGATKLVEVEMRLTDAVARDISTRFLESVQYLNNLDNWLTWRRHVMRVTGIELPPNFTPECDLVVCASIPSGQMESVAYLRCHGIRALGAEDYQG